MIIKINALDTLFFKDGKPFSMGEETWADGIFPPPPSVIYGALRSAYFGQHPEDFVNADTNIDSTNKLLIKSIYFNYGNNDNSYFPMPLDIVKKKSEIENNAYLMTNRNDIPLTSSILKNYILSAAVDEEIENVDNAIIGLGSLQRYLEGKENNFYYRRISEIVQSEPKVGIGRENSTRTSSEGKLYRVGMRRMEEMKQFGKDSNKLYLIVDFEGLQLNDTGFLKLGAEGKVASYEKLNNTIIPSLPVSEVSEFKLYLLTPAIFENGWMPDLTKNPLLKDLGIELISACIGKPITIGGFDMKKKIPKPMRKAVPAGSVYYLKTNNIFGEIIKALNGKSISEFDSAKEGYGICYIGVLK